MLKCILVLLGETPSSVSTRRYAFRLAQKTGADLAGLVPLCFRSSRQSVLQRITNFGNGALVSLWFRRSYERVLQRDTNVGTGTLAGARNSARVQHSPNRHPAPEAFA